VIASALTEREITPLPTLTVVVAVAAIAVTAHLASTNITRKLVLLGLIGKNVLLGLRQGEITNQKLPEKLLTAIYQKQRMKVES